VVNKNVYLSLSFSKRYVPRVYLNKYVLESNRLFLGSSTNLKLEIFNLK